MTEYSDYTANENTTEHAPIGRVLRASTVGFVCGTRSEEIVYPSFGAFVYTQHARYTDGLIVVGLIHAISIDDDPLVRQMVMANNTNHNAVQDQRVNRMVPVEISTAHVGFSQHDRVYHNLPPRPPLSLDEVFLCDDAMVERFTQEFTFLRLVLNTTEVPTEQLLAAALNHACAARPRSAQRDFLVRAGRELAGMLSHDLPRLHHLLKLIRPV